LRYGFSGKIIFGRAQAAAQNHDIGAKQSVLRGGSQTPEVVSNDAFENHLDAELIHLLGEIERIGIHAEGRQ
jgi:hypothetical protein